MTALHMSFRRILRESGRYLAADPCSRLRQRKSLRHLDDRLLADIGLTRGMAQRCRLFGRDESERVPIPSASEGNPVTQPDRSPSPAAPQGELIVRDARLADMPEIQAIYAHHVVHGLASFEELAPSTGEMYTRRAAVLAAGLPYLAAEIDGRVVGYSYATAYRSRPAYRHTIEVSVYVEQSCRGQGIGKALMQALKARCETGPWRQMVAVIGNSGNSGNAGSIGLHRSLGFHHVGTLRAVGFKCGRWVDTVIMQCALNAEGSRMKAGEPLALAR